MPTLATPPYQHCLVFAGGGFRFPYYLGVYAAACATGQTPDVLLAVCGGSIAATVIQRLPDDTSRLNWCCSRELYDYWQSVRPARGARVEHVLWGVMRRALDRRPAARMAALWDDYLFDIGARIPLPAHDIHLGTPAVYVVASRVLFERHEQGHAREGRRLLEEILIGPDAPGLVMESGADQGVIGPCAVSQPGNPISEQVRLESRMSLDDAARASITDMFYCTAHDVTLGASTHAYFGGALDLMPIELAHRLGQRVTMERKEPYGRIEQDAIRVVLGMDANARLQQVHAQKAAAWYDTTDISQRLSQHAIDMVIDWRRGVLRLKPPARYEDFVAGVHAQWAYGYERGLAAFGSRSQGL